MVRKNRAQSSSLFLMELILAILFFSITSAVCVQFFVKSHLLSQDAQILNHSVNECASVAEIADSSDSIADTVALLKDLYPDADYPSDTAGSAEVHIYYNKEFTPCSEADKAFVLALQLSDADRMLTADVNMAADPESDAVSAGSRYAEGATIYELHSNHNMARRFDNE